MEKIPLKQRDIILVPFPFSDRSGQKVRPALIISNNKFNQSGEDVVVCAMTSNLKSSKYSSIISPGDIEGGLLHEKSLVRADAILKIKKVFVIKRIAALNQNKFSEIITVLGELVKPS